MKTLKILVQSMFTVALLLLLACGKDNDVNPYPTGNDDDDDSPVYVPPPNASFSFSSGSAVVNASFSFDNNSTGKITSYYWDFGDGEGTSSTSDPVYTFKTIGTKTVKLQVNGPGGSDSYSAMLTVYTMPQDCHNFSSQHNMDAGVIQDIRFSGQVSYGNLVFVNDYAGDVKVELYHPDEWLNGSYKPWGSCYWTVNNNCPNGSVLITNDGYFTIGEDWGIRVIFSNGIKSCIRIINPYSKAWVSDMYYLKVKASDIFENTNSWSTVDSATEPINIIHPEISVRN